MAKDFKAIIENPERAAEYLNIFGRVTVCVISPVPEHVVIAGYEEVQAIYRLDLDEITDEEYQRLVIAIALKTGNTPDRVMKALQRWGFPILANECYIVIDHPERWIN